MNVFIPRAFHPSLYSGLAHHKNQLTVGRGCLICLLVTGMHVGLSEKKPGESKTESKGQRREEKEASARERGESMQFIWDN